MLVVNIFGGPGIGKSIVAAGLFYRLKQTSYSVEFVTEYTKDLVWENRDIALQNQPSILGEQYARLWRLRNKVDLVITDSPLLLSIFYNHGRWKFLPALAEELNQSFDSINYLLLRDEKQTYDSHGKIQVTVEEAAKIDVALRELLLLRMIPVTEVSALDEHGRRADRVAWIMCDLESRLDGD